jgi:hypothetical protein
LNKRWLPLIIVVLILSYFYVGFYGTPFGKIQARKDFEQYLSSNFSHSIEIDNVKYDLKNESYYANVHLKNNKYLQFRVRYFHKKIVDDYCENAWGLDISDKLGSEIATIFNNKVKFNTNFDFSDSLLKYQKRGDKTPNYFTLQKELEPSSHKSDLVSSTNINVFFPYDYPNNQTENQKLYELIQLIQKEVPCERLYLAYESSSFSLEHSHIQQIKSFEELPKYLEEYRFVD